MVIQTSPPSAWGTRPAVRVGYGLASLGAAGYLVALVLQVRGLVSSAGPVPAPPLRFWPLTAVGILLGLRMLGRAPRGAAGWLLLTTGVLAGVYLAVRSVLPGQFGGEWAPWVSIAIRAPVPVLLLLLLLPDDANGVARKAGTPAYTTKAVTRRLLLWAAVAVGALAAVVRTLALSVASVGGTSGAQGSRSALLRAGQFLGNASEYVLLIGLVCAVPYLLARARRAHGRIRRGLLLAALSWPASNIVVLAGLPWMHGTAALAWREVPWLVVAVVQWFALPDLLDVGVFLHRALLYGLLTPLLVPSPRVLDTATVGCVELLSPTQPVCASLRDALQDLALGLADRPTLAVASVALGVISLLSIPIHTAWRSTLDRFDGRSPDRAGADLATYLADALGPREVLTGIVTRIVATMRVPHAALFWPDEDQPAAVQGDLTDGWPTVTLEIRQHRELVATLVVAARSPDESFTGRDRRTLRDLADRAGPAVDAARLTWHLQHAREQLVLSREDERRRISRDLHDGLGPTLAGVTLQVGAARTLLDADQPAQACQLLSAMERELTDCTTEVRRLVRGLRPSGLDQRGLLTTLRQQLAPLAGPTAMAVDVDPGAVVGLPAAVEVAALRIAVEAATNTVRHAGARTCGVTIARDEGWLHVRVVDDGRGIQADDARGVGTLAMRERAAELGGVCAIEGRPDGGTTVHARFPLTTAEA
jgi:two-component system NarL family sensor kinase